MFIGIVQSAKYYAGGQAPSEISSVVINQTASVIEVDFNINVSEYNQKPTIEYVQVTGDPTKNEILTATAVNFFSPGAYNAATHKYQWFRATNKQSTGTAISGATNSTYTLTTDDIARYIRCVVIPVQSGGLNNEGDGVTSFYTEQVQDDQFNPFTNIVWFTAHRPAGAVDLAGNQYWLNEGSGNNSTRNASDPLPIYNPTQSAVEFTNTSSTELVLDQPSVQFSKPVEFWIRFKIKTQVGSWQRPICWTTDHHIEIRDTGAMYLSGGNTGYVLGTNSWKVMRFVVRSSASSSTFNVNNGAASSNVINASTGLFGVSNGRLGANNSGTGTFFNGYISHIFVKNGELSAGEQTNMWAWFQTNAPWD